MKTIAPFDLQKLIASHPELCLLDVRTPVEFAEVHVPQAQNEPLDRLEPKAFCAAKNLSPTSPVYILCRSGGRATKAAEMFAREGFDNCVVVEGGTLAWCAAGLPVNRSAVKVISLERQVRIAAGLLVLTGILLARFVHPGFIGLSAFVGAGLVFAGITDWCGMGMLLAKMPWNQAPSCVTKK
jgi:rhodanese-related sulfurtransferase